jgi:hypothetical protein
VKQSGRLFLAYELPAIAVQYLSPYNLLSTRSLTTKWATHGGDSSLSFPRTYLEIRVLKDLYKRRLETGISRPFLILRISRIGSIVVVFSLWQNRWPA